MDDSTGKTQLIEAQNSNENIVKSQTTTDQNKMELDGSVVDLDDIVLIRSQDEIFRLKIHRYKKIKHYLKGEVLGRGKFGVVREFIDLKTLKRFAGKIMQRRLLRRDTHLCAQINKELAITYHFNHRNVLRVYDLFCTSKKIYMFMEFCYGELNELLQIYTVLPKIQCKDYYSQIIEGLYYLHNHGIIHRDIKPENILVTPDHIIKLADFGVCQQISHFNVDDTVSGSDGTPLYHPPELFNIKIFRYSGSKIDIWAAGVVLYKMLTGELPFFNRPNSTNREAIDEILECNVQYVIKLKSDLLLIDLFNRIFEKEFNKRITIPQIKNHPWLQVDYNKKFQEKYFQLPTDNRAVDCYRGLTVLTRIYNKYYPPSPDQRLVNFKEFQESCRVLPMTRSSRYNQDPKRTNLVNKPMGEIHLSYI